MTTKIMIKSFLVNLGLTSLKLLGAFLSNSLTLMGDAIHCLSDMLTDIVSLIGTKIANKKPTKTHPYGYGKVEYLTSIIISLFIILLGIGIIYNSVSGSIQKPNKIGVIIMFLSIIIKLSLSNYLFNKGKELNSNILLTNAVESRYDSYCSIFAIIFLGISLIGKYKIFIYFDLIGSIIISILTIKVGITLLIENTSNILDCIETNEYKLNIIKNVIEKEKIVYKVKEIKLLKYGSYYIANITIKINEQIELNEIYITIKKIKENIKNIPLNIKHIDINLSTEYN